MVSDLVVAGHDLDKVWDYTPRMAAAFLTLIELKAKEDDARSIWANSLAAHGSEKDLNKAIKQLMRGY